MKKYALIKDGLVQTTFYSEQGPEAYPDIAPYLMEIDDSVQCNFVYMNGAFYDPAQPPPPDTPAWYEHLFFWNYW